MSAWTKAFDKVTGRDDREDMCLPAGRTCDDCFHFGRCEAFGMTWTGRTECDFSPSRFRALQAQEESR